MRLSDWIIVHAADVRPPIYPATPKTYPSGETIINNLYAQIFTIMTLLAGVFAIGYLIWHGIQYILSSGDPAKAKQARAGIVNAIIGIVIITAAYGIIRFAFSLANAVNTGIQ